MAKLEMELREEKVDSAGLRRGHDHFAAAARGHKAAGLMTDYEVCAQSVETLTRLLEGNCKVQKAPSVGRGQTLPLAPPVAGTRTLEPS